METQSMLGAAATVCVVSSYISQIVKGFRTRSLGDVSMGFLIIIIVGTALWILYAIVQHDPVFLVANAVILSSSRPH